jgi:hypothetical protein
MAGNEAFANLMVLYVNQPDYVNYSFVIFYPDAAHRSNKHRQLVFLHTWRFVVIK